MADNCFIPVRPFIIFLCNFFLKLFCAAQCGLCWFGCEIMDFFPEIVYTNRSFYLLGSFLFNISHLKRNLGPFMYLYTVFFFV